MGKSLETSKGSAWALFVTTHAVLVELMESRLVQAELPPLAWYDVLWGLERAPEQKLRMSELAEKVVFTRSNLTRLIDRLEEAGLVQRERSESDRRGAYAVLTAEGKAMRRKMWPVYGEAIRELFEARISDEQAETMTNALRSVLDAARSPPAETESLGRAARQKRGGNAQ